MKLNLNSLFEIFKERCKTVSKFINTKKGRNLFLIAFAIFVVLFFAPLFQGSVGAALVGCVLAPLTVLIWRRFDMRHAIVPAVFFCIPMILDMVIYHTLTTAVCLLVAAVCTIACAIHPAFKFTHTIKDDMYAYLACGAVCVGIVVLASLLILLVSIAWWLFCLFLFFAVVAVFFTVVFSTAAYTATDAKRQAKKKHRVIDNDNDTSYNFENFAQEIGLKNEQPRRSRSSSYDKSDSRYDTSNVTVRDKRKKKEPLFYDVD